MTVFTAREMAEAYIRISEINPPSPVGSGFFEFNDLTLLRSVDPRQHGYLAALSRSRGADSSWDQVRQAIADQREIRADVYSWIRALDDKFQRDPSNFVFPDPYSLLLWVWTFQLFQNCYISEPGDTWKKYFYRGEANDYGSTRFLPKITRPQFSHCSRSASVPACIRELLREHVVADQTWQNTENEPAAGIHLIETMSPAQALAVAQHYGYPTPLVDVTIHPEVALYFATLPAQGDVGVVGYWDANEAGTTPYPKELALILAPSLFSRIHLQSGYFICTSDSSHDLETPFRPLVFQHHPEVEPLLPTWATSVGPLSRGKDDPNIILVDPFSLEAEFKKALPDPPSEETIIDLNIITNMLYKGFVKRAITDKFCAAGRQGITDDGRRSNVVQPVLLYHLLRFATIYGFAYASTFATETEMQPNVKSLKEISETMTNVFRSIIITTMMKDNGLDKPTASRIAYDLDRKEVFRIMWATLRDGDRNALSYPLNTWYSGTA